MDLVAKLRDRRVLVVTALVVVHLAIPLVTLLQPGFGHDQHALQSDAHRFEQIATAPGVAGRDYRVEYPPLAVIGMRALGGDGLSSLMKRLVWLDAIADFAIAFALWRAWSRRAALVYLVLAAPLLAFLLNGFDLVATAIAIGGVACTRRGREVLGGVLIVAAAFLKLWPVLLLVVLWMWHRRRALVAASLTLVGGGAAWIAWSGLRGPIDVATFRGASGWHVESTPGVLLALFQGSHARYESGAWRVGAPPPMVGYAISILTLVALAYWYWRARGFNAYAAGTVTVGALGIVLAGATLLSPQYLVWGAPFAAIAAHERRWRVTGAYFAVMLMNTWYVASNDLTRPDNMVGHVEVLVRNAGLVAMVVVCARELYCVSHARRASASTSTYAVDPLTSTITECNVPVNALGAS